MTWEEEDDDKENLKRKQRTEKSALEYKKKEKNSNANHNCSSNLKKITGFCLFIAFCTCHSKEFVLFRSEIFIPSFYQSINNSQKLMNATTSLWNLKTEAKETPCKSKRMQHTMAVWTYKRNTCLYTLKTNCQDLILSDYRDSR